jgi:hypothetical protein
VSYIGAEPTTAAFPFDQFSGDGTTTAFTLTYAPASTTSIIVAISGVVQNPNLYSVIGTTITFSPAPPTGTNNISVLYLGLPVQIGTPIPGSRLELALGSAANPSLTFLGDTNTGIFSPAADTIAFSEGGVESMRIDASGNMGLGVTPSYKLDVSAGSSGSGVVNTFRLQNVGTTVGDGAKILFTAGTSTDGAGIASTGVALNSADLRFYTGGNTERMRIDSSGLLLVGTTSVSLGRVNISGYTNGDKFGLAMRPSANNATPILFQNAAGTDIGTIATTSTATTYNTSSDYRLKHDIAPMQNALATVAQLKPVTYKWNADDSESQGFIAHELQAVVPDCVTGEKDAVDSEGKPVYQGIDTSFLVATLTAAIQELKAELDATKAEVALLKGAA